MNERGFFTLIGVASILVIGLQETSRNYIIVADNFKNESDLKNIADSALIEAVNMIDPNDIEKYLPQKNLNLSRYHSQRELFSRQIDKKTDVKVVAEYGKYTDGDNERGSIIFFEREHKSDGVINDKVIDDTGKEGVILISVASRKIDDDTTIYRRSMAYVLKENEKGELDFKTIYFMNSLKDD